MFKACLSETPLTTAAANEYFSGRIWGDSFRGDTTTVAIARAFLDHRMPGDDTFKVQFRSAAIDKDYVEGHSATAVIDRITQGWSPYDYGTFTFYNLSHPVKDANMAVMAAVRSKFGEVFEGWEVYQRPTDYFHGYVKNGTVEVLCLLNENNRSVVVFVDNLTLSKVHLIQGVMLGLLPWFFDRETEEKTPEDLALIKSCSNKDESAFLAALKTFAEKYDFETERLKRLLGKYESSYERRRKSVLEQNIADYNRQLESLQRDFRSMLSGLRDAQVSLMGLDKSIEEAEANPEVLAFFLDNRDRLVLQEVNGEHMKFIVRDYLAMWDEGEAENIIENYRSDAYNCDRNFTKEQTRLLLRALFIDQEIKLRLCAAFDFSLDGNVAAISNYNFGSAGTGYMPNPHHQYYHCITGFVPDIVRSLQNRDYVGAITQTIASTKSLTVADTAVMDKFYRDILSKGDHNRAFELPDGRIVTSAGAIEWLEAQHPTEVTVDE